MRTLRVLLRDRGARNDAGLFVLEGPRLIGAALDAGATLRAVYVGPEASPGTDELVDRARVGGATVHALAPGVAVRVGDTVTPQAVFALAALNRADTSALSGATLAVVGAPITDPGNAGTLMRSAAAAGAQAFALGTGSVDAYNPKVVRASGGALFGIRIVEGVSAVEILEACRAAGLVRLGAVASGGASIDDVDLTLPTAFVLGHEARGLDADLPLDGTVTIPMRPPAESLNVAMAGTVLLFEAARRRRSARKGP